jgi:hypothetical protein
MLTSVNPHVWEKLLGSDLAGGVGVADTAGLGDVLAVGLLMIECRDISAEEYLRKSPVAPRNTKTARNVIRTLVLSFIVNKFQSFSLLGSASH